VALGLRHSTTDSLDRNRHAGAGRVARSHVLNAAAKRTVAQRAVARPPWSWAARECAGAPVSRQRAHRRRNGGRPVRSGSPLLKALHDVLAADVPRAASGTGRGRPGWGREACRPTDLGRRPAGRRRLGCRRRLWRSRRNRTEPDRSQPDREAHPSLPGNPYITAPQRSVPATAMATPTHAEGPRPVRIRYRRPRRRCTQAKANSVRCCEVVGLPASPIKDQSARRCRDQRRDMGTRYWGVLGRPLREQTVPRHREEDRAGRTERRVAPPPSNVAQARRSNHRGEPRAVSAFASGSATPSSVYGTMPVSTAPTMT